MAKTINVTISPEGKVTIETNGFKGTSCLVESQFLKDALGLESEQKPKSSFYAVAENEKQSIFIK